MIANVRLQVLTDSGASINVIDEKVYHAITKSPQNNQLSLRHTSTKMYSYCATKLQLNLTLYLVIAQTNASVNTTTPLSTLIQVHLHIDPSVPPVTQPHRRIPFHLRKKLDTELDKLERQGIIEPICANPIVRSFVNVTLLADKSKRTNELNAKKLRKLEDSNRRLQESVIDPKARFMRDNLLFFNVNEDERENTTEKIYKILERNLEIPNAKTKNRSFSPNRKEARGPMQA
ncbi:Hypothetical predicted protein [Paramuricea clavata]|uniref:Uncharacterized protein n=1 Tax=Paramuricea clavata TaxID=317549 RepID=A0A6S7FWP8_PARCT|nr:Hypothetical predicted protein [Paramuricea clavata]